MSYHKNGMINQVVHANGVTDTFLMDDASMQRPKRITVSGQYAGTWSTGDISYDGAGNITTMGSDWFLYDGISRLTQAHLADVDRDGVSDAVDIAYRYDPFGNRTDTYWSDTDEQGGMTTSWYTSSVDAATNRLLGETYESKDNMTSLHGDTFTWYPFNQLQTRTGTGRNFTYGYTVDGERLMTRDLIPDPAHFTITVRDLDGKVIRQFGVNSEVGVYSWEKDYIYANGKLLATVDPIHTRHHHLDHLGTPRVITDTSGNRIAYNAYSPFGLQLTGETNERHKFTGHERDPGNLDYMHARYYSPAVSRFLSVDPVSGKAGSSQGWNRYTYVSSNPLKLIDVDGRLERDANGNLKYTSGPIGMMYFEKDGGLRYRVEQGTLTTDKGNTIQAISAVPTRRGSTAGQIIDVKAGKPVGYIPNLKNPAATNCHGTTFADGKFSIDPSQVDTIINDDGWEKQESGNAKKGDILIYRDKEGNPAHSVTVEEVSEKGEVTLVSGLNGPETEVKYTTVEQAWDTDEHTVERYRK